MSTQPPEQKSEGLFSDLDRWVIKQRSWKVYSKSRRLLNWTHEPRSIPKRGKGGFLSETLVIYNIELIKTHFIRIPEEIEYFYTYPTYIEYSCTLFDKNK